MGNSAVKVWAEFELNLVEVSDVRDFLTDFFCQLCATLAAAILLMSAIRHRDFLRENNQLLRDLTEKNVQILGHLQQQEVLWSMQLRELERQKSKQVSILHEGQ